MHEEAPAQTQASFDPHARFVDGWGIAYPSFKAFLFGCPYQDDRCNDAVEALRKKGRSQAFCKTFAEGYRRGKPADHEGYVTLVSQESNDGWDWAWDIDLVDESTWKWRSASVHNYCIGLGYAAARRATESDPSA